MSDSEPTEENLEGAEEQETVPARDDGTVEPTHDADVLINEQLSNHDEEAEEEEEEEQFAPDEEPNGTQDQGASGQNAQEDEEGLQREPTANEEGDGVNVEIGTSGTALLEKEASDIKGSPSGDDRVLSGLGQVEDEVSGINLYPEPDTSDRRDYTELPPSEVDVGDELVLDHSEYYNASLQQHQGIPTPPPLPYESEDTTYDDEDVSPSILNMAWSFGINKNIAVKNISTENAAAVFFACSNVGVIYHFNNNRQVLLQGHSNALSCTCVSADRRWLVTADKGPNSMVIVWDASTGVPIKTIFDTDAEGGCVAVALSHDSRYLATMSAFEDQTVAIWDWTTESESPLCTAKLQSSYDVQSYLSFNQDDVTQLVSNSETQVIFYRWFGGKLEYFAPPLTDEDFNKPVGKFSQTVYLRKSGRALTATNIGNMVVWECNKAVSPADSLVSPDKRALKIVRIQERAITVLTVSDDYIVSADVQGHVKFFDQSLKLLHWYHDFHLGPINSVSFKFSADIDYSAKSGGKFPSDSTIKAQPFVVRDFIVGTVTNVVANVTVEGTDVKVILQEPDDAVHAVAVHPNQPTIVIGSYSGMLKLWQYNIRRVITTRMFDRGLAISCCTYDPKGQFIAIGFTNGTLRLVDSVSLEDCTDQPFSYTRHDSVTHISFSHNCEYLATADEGFAVTLYKRSSGKAANSPYAYLGRYRAHYGTIRTLMFGVMLDSNKPRLLSLGEDRLLVEYDLVNSRLDSIQLLSSDRIEQIAKPLTMLWYPHFSKESFILVANNQYKFKLFNSATKMCRKTLLGPTYGSPIQKIVMLPNGDPSGGQQFLAYMINNKVGLVMLPLTGNPHRAAALVAHPQGVSDIACSYDGRFLFTVGGKDCCVNMWKINYSALEAQARLGGEGLKPLFGLIEGGEEGEVFREMEDYFYYAQLRSQGINLEETRQVSDKIPLSEIPFVMRALGYYPTEQEIEEMINEVKFENYVETGEYTTEIDLPSFITLYVNHKPAFGLELEQIRWAFDILQRAVGSTNGGINRGELLHLLQSKGEQMTETELAEHLSTLLGFSVEEGCDTSNDLPPVADIIDEKLPEVVTADQFAEYILGFGPCDQLQQKPPQQSSQIRQTTETLQV